MNGKLEMEVDIPSCNLKRSNSVPTIHTTMANSSTSTTTAPIEREPHLFPPIRNRRYSASSFSPIYNTALSPKLLRVNQLKQEESTDIVNREVAHEKELHNNIQMSQSWEDLTIMVDKMDGGTDTNTKVRNRVYDPLHLNLPISNCPPLCSTPSPTAIPRQCFSPSILSPSPTRKFSLRRSLSPIALRPSSFGPVKRKLEDDGDDGRLLKRPSFGLLTTQKMVDRSISPLATPESFIHTDSDSSSSNM